MATGKGKGTSGGVGFARRATVDVCREPEDLVPGRLLASAVKSRAFGFFFIYSMYGVAGDVERTVAIWEVAHRHAQSHGLPFVIGGDRNHGPALMTERWPGPLVLVDPTEPTCRASEPGSILDYFGVHPSLEFVVKPGLRLVGEAFTFPHWLVVMGLEGAGVDEEVQVWMKAKPCQPMLVFGPQMQHTGQWGQLG